MRRWRIIAVFIAGGLACTPPPEASRTWSRQGGSLGLSADDTRLYVADADNDELLVVDTSTESVISRVKVGKWPERVVVATDGRIFVSNRHGRSVSVVDQEALVELARIEVGAEPRGLAFTPDGRTLVVANSMSQDLSIIDVESMKVVRTVATGGGDPRGITTLPNGRALVTYTRSEKVSVIDLATGTLRSPMTLALAPEKTVLENRLPGMAVDPVYSADDDRVYVSHVQMKDDPVPTDVETPGGAYAGAAEGGSVPVVANAVVTVDASSETVIDAPGVVVNAMCLDDCTESARANVPPVMKFATGPEAGPVAAALATNGDWLFVVNEFSNNVTLVETRGRGTTSPAVKVGSGPNGIAIASTGDRAWVFNAFDHTVTVLLPSKGGVTAARTFKVGQSPLTPEEQLGRKLFFTADDERLSNSAAGGISCASCHPSGREDGKTWQFSEGPRNTPTLAGRKLSTNAPYHWDGAIKDMPAFQAIVEQRMGGAIHGQSLLPSDFNAMLAFLEALPAPDNPNRRSAPTAQHERGRHLFEGSARCITCHTGPDFTDEGFHDVGTRVMSNPNGHPDWLPGDGFNTPPLHNLFATAPYLHDGSADTLADVIRLNKADKHGVTSHLSAEEVEDLVAYLEAL